MFGSTPAVGDVNGCNAGSGNPENWVPPDDGKGGGKLDV